MCVWVCVSQTLSVLENKKNRGTHTQTAGQRRSISEGGTVVVWNTVYEVQTALTEQAEKSLRKEEVGEGWSSAVTEEELMVDMREQEYIMSVGRNSVTAPSPSLNMKAGIVWFSFTGPDLNNMFLEQCLTFNKIFAFIHLLNWYFDIWIDQSYCQRTSHIRHRAGQTAHQLWKSRWIFFLSFFFSFFYSMSFKWQMAI